MYCPRCNTENESGRGYCRRCGLPLGGVRLALEGQAEGALSKYRKGAGALAAGAVTSVACALIALLNSLLSSEPRNYGVLINLLVGLLVATPMIVAGLVRVSRAERLLGGKDLALPLVSEQAGELAPLPPAGREINPLAGSSPQRNSVAEQTTLELQPGAERR
jgi:hypothetical protein